MSVLLVFGAPFAASRYGAFGVLVVLGMLLVLGSATALVAGRAVRRCGLRGARLWRFALPLVSPFSAPYAPDRVLAVAARGRSPLESARYLMGEPEFARWSRPHVFDALAASRGHRDGPAPDATAPLLEGFSYQLTAGALERLLGASAPEVQTGSAFCPRCGLEYRASQAVCDDCGGIALAIAGAGDENTR